MDMNPPTVTRIRVEYDDGSSDGIELLQRGQLPLYGLSRNRPVSESPRGAYTAAAIAALLFGTTFTTKRTEYSSRDKKFTKLIRCWLEELPPAENGRDGMGAPP